MDTALIVGIIGAVVSILSIVITNFLNRRKYNQELKSGEYDWKSKELDLYKDYDELKNKTIKDLTDKVEKQSKEIVKLRESVDKDHLESIKLGSYVKELIEMIQMYYCCVLTCKARRRLTDEEVNKLSHIADTEESHEEN